MMAAFGQLHIRAGMPHPFISVHGIQLYAYEIHGGIKPQEYAANPLEMVPHKEGEELPVVAKLDLDSAQELMDDLWRCGIRPAEGEGVAGSMSATIRHLDDMRTLVEKAYKLEFGRKNA